MIPNNYNLGVSILNSQGVVTTPLKKTCYKKRGAQKAQEEEG